MQSKDELSSAAGAGPSTAQHTPGPWHFVPDNAGLMSDHGYGILYGEPDAWGWEKNLFVSVGCSHNVERALGKGAAEANARLIASAPDLLAALEMVRDQSDLAMNSTPNHLVWMRASVLTSVYDAIAKAKAAGIKSVSPATTAKCEQCGGYGIVAIGGNMLANGVEDCPTCRPIVKATGAAS